MPTFRLVELDWSAQERDFQYKTLETVEAKSVEFYGPFVAFYDDDEELVSAWPDESFHHIERDGD